MTDIEMASLSDPSAGRAPGGFVAYSEISVPANGASALVEAFAGRIGEVESWPGFDRLEVWRDQRDETRFVMVSWWDSQDSFTAYMRSDSHHRSHDRMEGGADRPRPAGFSRFQVVAR